LPVSWRARAVVKQEHGAITPAEELLEGQNLPAVADGILGHQSQFGHRVEHNPLGLELVDLGDHRFGGLA